MTDEIEKLHEIIAAQAEVIRRLTARVAELERMLGLDSSNSSKPPSSDGLKKPPRGKKRTSSLRGKSGKKSGGQKGHKGHNLAQVDNPDKTEHHRICECFHCRAKLDASNVTGSRKRQVFDIPEPRLEVTEHVADIARCPDCGRISKANFPESVTAPAQYGPRIRAAAVYFNIEQLVPEDRTAQIMSDLFAAPGLSPASIASWVNKKASEFEPVFERLKAWLRREKVRHLDETGFRIGGRTCWLHTVSSLAVTCYFPTEKRGDIPLFLQGAGGVSVHDHFKPYYRHLSDLEHALCNAHHLRELNALIEHDREEWAEDMKALLLTLHSLVRQAKEKEMSSLPPPLLEKFGELYDLTVEMGLDTHRSLPPPVKTKKGGRKKRRPGHNLLRRLRDFRADVLRFAHDFDVPFTNNLAEQALRMMKVRMKISGGFRTMPGAQSFATLRSITATARKQGRNILKSLAESACGCVMKLGMLG